MPRSPRKPTRRHGGRLAHGESQRRKERDAAKGKTPIRPKLLKAPSVDSGALAASVLPMPSVGLTLEPTGAFLADARRLLTELQLEALKVHVLREPGSVFFRAGAACIRYVRFEGFRVWLLDDFSARKVILVGLEPDTNGDDPKPPTGKMRKAMRWGLDKVWTYGVYEVVRWLRGLLGLRTAATAFSEHRKATSLINCAPDYASMHRYECKAANPLVKSSLVLDSLEDLEVVHSWYIRIPADRTHSYGFMRSRLVLDDAALEDSFIRDVLSELCFFGKHSVGAIRLRMDISPQRQ